jgi:hypothetical protein
MPPAPFTTWIVWLSSQPIHPPCVTRHGTHNTTVTCAEPISRLRPDSILADWTSNTALGEFRSGPGRPITVGGRHGIWRVQSGSAGAPDIGETEVITVTVPIPHSRDSWDQLTAMLRRPNVPGLTARLETMLESVRWLPQ